MLQLLSVLAIKSSIVVKSKKKWWKESRITVRPIEKRKEMSTRSKMQQDKDQSDKKETKMNLRKTQTSTMNSRKKKQHE